jgi:hypothetical protein
MTKGRDNAAESLSDVIELVRIRRQSGSLSVERLQGGRFEEGEIYFQAGQPTYAHTGIMSGQEALTWMLNWHQVFFTFIVEDQHTPATISFGMSAHPGNALATNVPTASFPAPLPQGSAKRNLPTTAPIVPQMNKKEVPRSVNEPEKSSKSGEHSGVTGTPGLEWLIPQKVGKERDVLSLPLTRPQRSIYLLVDGRRTISDLSRCTRKSMQEIERLLSELREQGLISI